MYTKQILGQKTREPPLSGENSTPIAHYEYIASARMTPVLREAMLCFSNHGVLLLQIAVSMCPAEFADIFEPC